MSGRILLDASWMRMLQRLGADPATVATAAGLRPARLAEDLIRLSVDEYLRLVEATDLALDDPGAPIRLTQVPRENALSPVLFAALSSADLTASSRRIAKHKRLIAPMRMDVANTVRGLEISWMWDDPTIRSPRLLIAVELVTMVQIARIGLGEPIAPLRVFSPVPLGATASYADFFGCPVERGEQPCVVFRAEHATRPFDPTHQTLWERFEPALRRRQQAREGLPVADRTYDALLAGLPAGEFQLGPVSRRLGMSGRTLQRRLEAEQTTFREVVRRTRSHVATHYLKETTLSYENIAFLVGFDTMTSFFRAYRDWTGQTPQSARRGQSGNAAGTASGPSSA